MLLNEIFYPEENIDHEGQFDLNVRSIIAKPYSMLVNEHEPESPYGITFLVYNDTEQSDGVLFELKLGQPSYNEATDSMQRAYVSKKDAVSVTELGQDPKITPIIATVRHYLESCINLDTDAQERQINQVFKSVINQLNSK